MREYSLLCTIESRDLLYKAADIAFQAGKGACGLVIGGERNTHLFFICGKFSDMVRVYSALKNNGFKTTITEYCEVKG